MRDYRVSQRYFTTSHHKRSISLADEDERIHKIITAMIAVYAPEHVHSSTEESAFPAKEVSNIKIPKSYIDSIRDPLHAQESQEAIQKMLRSLKANGTWKEVILPPGTNFVSMKWVFTTKMMVDGTIERLKARLVARGFSQDIDLIMMRHSHQK
jgi:hypothetical protein